MSPTDAQVADAVRAYVNAGKRGCDLLQAMRCAIEAAAPVEAALTDSARLDHIYHIAMVEPFIAPIATKERWMESIDRAIEARIQSQREAS